MSVGIRPFDEIVAEQGATVLRVCRAVLGPIDADDAWSETFLAALRAYPSLAAGSNVTAWLVTIARNKSIDQLRARARRPVPHDVLPDSLPGRLPGIAAPGADVLVEQREVWSLVAGLTERQREAVVYHHVAGLSYAEVAAIVGGTEAAARRAAADGRAALRRRYEEPAETTRSGAHP